MGELQRELKRLRELCGLTQTQVAKEVGYVPSAVSNWETRRHSAPKRSTIEALDKLYGAHGGLVRVWESHTRNGEVPIWLRNDAQLAERAVSIEVVTPTLVPGLLQSPSYARYTLCEGRPSDPMDVIESLVKVRCGQLDSLGDSLRISATFPELGIAAVPATVRKEQASHLIKLIGTGRITAHLVPRGSILAGVTSPYQVYLLRDGTRAATIDHTNGSVLVNETPGVARLTDLARASLGCASSRDETLARLKELSQ
jgi:transcriptional regulator with XRE-family HTH domain